MTKRIIVPLFLAAGMCAAAFAGGVTEEQTKAAVDAFKTKMTDMRKAGDVTDEMRHAAASEALAGIDLTALTPAQVKTLEQPIWWSPERNAIRDHMRTLAKEPTADGAQAAILVLTLTDNEEADADEQAAMIHDAATHPGLGAALVAGKADDLFFQASNATPDAIRKALPDLLGMERLLTSDLKPQAINSARYLYAGLLELGDETAKQAQGMRTRILSLAKGALASAEDERTKERLENTVAFLDGAFAKGQLIGHPAPALTIEWSSDPAIKSIADLAGKVVVLDFWATWCGPCIRSFPEVQNLVAHYEGYPVAVVGVTSLQGGHWGQEGKVDTEGDPAKEHGLMPSFIEWKGMTWPVVFTKEDVFNTDFGVSGIPHVAIIDPSGKVRYNALRPYGPMEEKTRKIDGLLKEAGLATPPPAEPAASTAR